MAMNIEYWHDYKTNEIEPNSHEVAIKKDIFTIAEEAISAISKETFVPLSDIEKIVKDVFYCYAPFSTNDKSAFLSFLQMLYNYLIETRTVIKSGHSSSKPAIQEASEKIRKQEELFTIYVLWPEDSYEKNFSVISGRQKHIDSRWINGRGWNSKLFNNGRHKTWFEKTNTSIKFIPKYELREHLLDTFPAFLNAFQKRNIKKETTPRLWQYINYSYCDSRSEQKIKKEFELRINLVS